MVYLLGRQLAGENQKFKNEISVLKEQQLLLQAQQVAIGQLNKKIKGMQEQEKELNKIVANLQEIPKKKRRNSELLIALSSILPSTVRCEKIVLAEKSGQITGKAIVYRDLPAFVRGLNENPLFHSVSLEVVDQEDGQDVDLFTFRIVFGIRLR